MNKYLLRLIKAGLWIYLFPLILISACAGTKTTVPAPENYKNNEWGRVAKEIRTEVYVNRNGSLVLGKGTIKKGSPVGVTDVEVK